MIYTFRIISAEIDHFIREVETDSQCSFLDFHNFLNQEMAFDPAEMASFFLTDHLWHKQTEITLLNMMEDEYGDIREMATTRLGELISVKKQRLLYVFDLFAERILFLELTQIRDGQLEQPTCIRREGEPPPPFRPETMADTDLSFLEEDDPLDDFSENNDLFDEDGPDFIDLDEDLY